MFLPFLRSLSCLLPALRACRRVLKNSFSPLPSPLRRARYLGISDRRCCRLTALLPPVAIALVSAEGRERRGGRSWWCGALARESESSPLLPLFWQLALHVLTRCDSLTDSVLRPAFPFHALNSIYAVCWLSIFLGCMYMTSEL